MTVQLGEVARCSTCMNSGADFAQHRNVAPLIFTNFTTAHGWGASERWQDVEYLQSTLGDTTSSVQRVDKAAQFDPSTGSQDSSLMPWNKALDAIFNGTDTDGARLYLKSGMSPKLLKDVEPVPKTVFGFEGKEQLDMQFAKVWVGSKGNVTPLHFDMCHGCLIQICGAKRVVLFPLAASRSLYPFSSSTGAPRTSRLDLTALLEGCQTTIEQFPLALDAVGGLHCTVQAGEALYIPPFWWHHVTAAEHNVSVLMPFDLSSAEQRSAERPWAGPDWGVYA